MSDRVDGKRVQIITAGISVFGRYGYRRTSMDLIARTAGVSRPALYQYFKNKQEVFRAVAQHVSAQVTTAAREAGEKGRALPAEDRLYLVLAVKLDVLTGSVRAESHAELFREAADIAADTVHAFEESYRTVIEDVLHDCADELDLLGPVLSARDTADLLCDALAGIAQARQAPQAKHARLRHLAQLTVRGLTRTPEDASTC
ncbi:helix-turn-helix domain-containing protein [Streptomyces sp. NPDC046881]|uniref:TetR/AcrR family transcriptional regulator n=1 Tax=Streptomyces sp. NPDC046881 TaxID=3155374 RepID=UPI0033D3A0DF